MVNDLGVYEMTSVLLSDIKAKEKLREKTRQAVDLFLSSGGKITLAPKTISGRFEHPVNQKHRKALKKKGINHINR